MIIGVQGPEGQIKLKVGLDDTYNSLIKKIEESYPNLPDTYRLWKDPHKDYEILSSNKKHDLSYGDRIYVEFIKPKVFINEDDVDKIIESNPGIVKMPISDQCNHSNDTMCLKCSPMQVYRLFNKMHETAYLDTIQPPLKYMSFHVFLRRMLDSSTNKNNFSLDEIRCGLLSGCRNHQPYPAGICTKCQPPSMTLKHQAFRHVDNIMFEGHEDLDMFISFWRKSMCQRLGFLYGNYGTLENIPLGIRANIHCIYEPLQTNTFSSIKLHDDSHFVEFNTCAEALGLKMVGWIITDLLIDPKVKGNVIKTRSSSTYHLSAQECITAAHYQNLHPNYCKYSPSGIYGSKFVTVVVTGNDEGQIDFQGWQVSNQCMALVRDNCLVPTIDEPSLAYVKDSGPTQFVPDVYYQETDEYKNSISKIARPVPVEYFLIDVPTGFPVNPITSQTSLKFPLANRQELNQIQTFSGIDLWFRDPVAALKNIHFVSFLYSKLEPFLQEHLLNICRYLTNNDHNALTEAFSDIKFSQITEFVNINQNLSTKDPASDTSNLNEITPLFDNSNVENTQEDGDRSWSCPHCTFINSNPTYDDEGFLVCEVCRIPKQQ